MKHVLCSLLAVLFAATATADDYALYVGGKQVKGGASAFNVTADGKVKYDPKTRTLSLRNAVIRDTVCAIHNAGIDSLTILVEGTDSIFTTSADAIRAERNTFIRSESHEGQLCISVIKKNKKDSIADYAALRVGGGSNLHISDCYLKMSSEGWAVKGGSQETLAIATAEVSAQTKDTKRSCIEGFSSLTMRSVVTNGGESYNANTMALFQYNSAKKAQQVLIQGCLYLGRYIVDVMRQDSLQNFTHASTGLKKGRIKYDRHLQTLTLDSSTVQTTGCPAIRNVSMQLLTIAVLGPNTVTASGSDALRLLTSTTLRGAAKVGGQLVVKSNAGGIYQGGINNYATLTLSGVTLDVDAATNGIYGDGKTSQLSIDNARVKAFTTSAGGTYRAVGAFAGCTMRNTDCANGAAWRQATGNFDRNDGTTAREVILDVPTAFYPVSILGHALNNLNSADIAIDGMTGTGSASYNTATKTLSLNNMTIRQTIDNGYYSPAAVSLTEPGLTISVSGTNSITYSCGISANYGATLTGPGTLNIVGTEGPAIATGSNDMFTVACAVLNAKGRDYGFKAESGGGLTLAAATGQTTTTHTFSGSYGNIHTPALTLNGMNFYQPVCCYFSPSAGGILQNGGRVVTEEVTFRQVTQRYGVKIMGVEIDNCNATGIGAPFISTTQFMNFNEATNTLTLDNFSLNSTEEEINMIESERDGLQIVVKGTCSFSTAASAFFKVNNPKKTGRVDNTFRGDGTLDIKARYFTMLVGKKSGLTFTDNITVTGEGAISGNSLGKNDERITVEGNAYITCKGLEGNPAMEQFVSIKIDSPLRIVEPNWGTAKQFNNGYAIADRQGQPYTGQLEIGKPKSYGLYVGEDLVTTANYSDINGKGQFFYDPDRQLLTLYNANLDNTKGELGGGIDNRDVEVLNINILGDNKLEVRNNVIYSERSINIIGSGSLKGTSTDGIALWLFGGDCGVRGPKITLHGKTYAIRGNRNTEKLMVYDTDTQITLTTDGRSTVSGLGGLSLQSGLYITEPYAAVFDSDYGGITVGGLIYNGTVVISNREQSAIDTPSANAPTAVAVYDQGGRQLRQQQRGLNIVRMSDGSVSKVICR